MIFMTAAKSYFVATGVVGGDFDFLVEDGLPLALGFDRSAGVDEAGAAAGDHAFGQRRTCVAAQGVVDAAPCVSFISVSVAAPTVRSGPRRRPAWPSVLAASRGRSRCLVGFDLCDESDQLRAEDVILGAAAATRPWWSYRLNRSSILLGTCPSRLICDTDPSLMPRSLKIAVAAGQGGDDRPTWPCGDRRSQEPLRRQTLEQCREACSRPASLRASPVDVLGDNHAAACPTWQT